MAKTNIIGLKEFRENTETYVKRVNRGESITVMRRSTPLFKLTPVDTEEMGWKSIVDFTELDPRGVSARDILSAIQKLDG